jgi:5'-deoxynucleotidase YfbR-like HD superfamily hydrolase
MGNLTLAVPENVHQEMRHFPEVKWSEVARRAIIDKLETLRLAESLAQKSKLTEKDVKEFGKKIKSLATKRFLS